MSEKPLEPPRRDPTATLAIARADRQRHDPGVSVLRYRYDHTATPPAVLDMTLDEVRARRASLRSVLAGLCADLETCLPHERKMLGLRKSSVDASLSHLKRKEATLVASLPMPRIVPDGVACVTHEQMAAIGAMGTLHYMLRMFHHYRPDDLAMPDHHRSFMGNVGRILKDAGYDTRIKGMADPLDGLTDETEAA